MDKAMQGFQLRHRSRLFQIPIYLGKLFRSFIYMNDWKILPMTAVIAALVSMVIRRNFFVTMEGTLTGAFALTCVAIWNGCFNSIQVVCRERGTVKREHRSGMHVSSYIVSHMIYQAILCLLQTAITLYVCSLSGVQFPQEGFISRWMMLDLGVTVLLITYASDMVSLFFSSISHTTTAAMTVMPFILIFQLVFSGSIFTLPDWATKISNYTISNYGLKCITMQADYNNLPMMTGWNTLNNVAGKEISGEIKISQVMDALSGKNGAFSELRGTTLGTLINRITGASLTEEENTALQSEYETLYNTTIGEVIDVILAFDVVQEYKDTSIHFSFTPNQIMDMIGKEKVKAAVIAQTSSAMHNEKYERTAENIHDCWFKLAAFILFFAFISIIALEFIDKDRR